MMNLKRDALRPVRLWVLSAVFAGVVTLGQSFGAFGTAEGVTAHKLKSLLFLLGQIPLYYALMRLAMEALSRERKAAKRDYRAWQAGGVLLLCWLPWYACLFPGTVSNDSISQLKMILGLAPLSNANPICQTGLIAFFRWIGFGSADAAVALYCITQAVLMAWLLGAVLSEMNRSAAPGWLVIVSFLFYAFCPVFPVFAFCVGKDTNFAMAVLFLSLEVWRAMTLPRIKPVRMICMAAAAALCVVLRNPGVYLAAITLALALVRSLRRGTWQAPLCGLASAAVVFGTLHLAVIPAMNIAPMPASEEYSIPLQQIARVAAGGGLTELQKETLSEVLEVERLAEVYNGELSDPVKDLWRADASDEAVSRFWKTWAEIALQHPATSLSATFHNTYGYLTPGYLSTIKPTLLIGDQSTRTASVKGLFDYSINPLSTPLKSFTEWLNGHALYRILVSPGLYGWITLFAAALLLRGKGKAGLICAVPALFTLAGCMLSAVNGYFRYAMPLYLCAPFLLWLAAQKNLSDR